MVQGNPMTAEALTARYRAYIACLNARDWAALPQFVHAEARHNGRRLGVDGYRAMLEQDCDDIPDLHFTVQRLVVQVPQVASRLAFHCSPRATFRGLAVNGRRVSFHENVIYAFQDDKVIEVWSVIDKAEIEAQLTD